MSQQTPRGKHSAGAGVKRLIVVSRAPVPQDVFERHFPDIAELFAVHLRDVGTWDESKCNALDDRANIERYPGLEGMPAFAAAPGGAAFFYPYLPGGCPPAWLESMARAGVRRVFFRHNRGGLLLLKLDTALRRARLRGSCLGKARGRALADITELLLKGCNRNGGLASASRMLLNTLAACQPGARMLPRAESLLQTPPRAPRTGKNMRVTHWIGSLGPGGAERQLCYLLRGLHAREYRNLRLLTAEPLTGTAGHYRHLLADLGIPHAVTTEPSVESEPPDIFSALPYPGQRICGAVYQCLKDNPPDVFHTWMDHCNTYGGVAALAAGVPSIVLSFRNVSPTHFPYLYSPWLRQLYRFLAKSERVHFISNSAQGARDYAKWIGLAPERVRVILNGLDFTASPPPQPEEMLRFRSQLGLRPNTPLVAGIFRLSAEKQPIQFLRVLQRLFATVPDAHAIHAGIGPMEGEFREALAAAGIADRVHLLGRREDIPVLLSAADALLLTSLFEGTPNVLIEAQGFGCPVVTTCAGGAPECLEHGSTGFVHRQDDIAGMAESLRLLLTRSALRAEFSAAAKTLSRRRFSIDSMVDGHLDFYRSILPSGVL